MLRVTPQPGKPPMLPQGPQIDAAPAGPPPPMAGGPPMLPDPPLPDGGSDGSKKLPMYDAEKVSAQISGYKGPEMGPFACAHCLHWEEPSGCGIVQGKIDPAGLCNLFERDGDDDTPEDPNQAPDPEAPLGPPPIPLEK